MSTLGLSKAASEAHRGPPQHSCLYLDGCCISGPQPARFIAKALQDNRLLDLPLSLPLCKVLTGHPLTLPDVTSLDPVLGRSLQEMHRMAAAAPGPQSRSPSLQQYVEALHLDFTLPGTDG